MKLFTNDVTVQWRLSFTFTPHIIPIFQMVLTLRDVMENKIHLIAMCCTFYLQFKHKRVLNLRLPIAILISKITY